MNYGNQELNVFLPADEEIRKHETRILEDAKRLKILNNEPYLFEEEEKSNVQSWIDSISNNHLTFYEIDDFNLEYNVSVAPFDYPTILTPFDTEQTEYHSRSLHNDLSLLINNKNKHTFKMMNQLAQIPGLVIAGGSVLSLLRFEESGLIGLVDKSYDIDIFCIHPLESKLSDEEIIRQKTTEIFNELTKILETDKIFVVRTGYSVNFRINASNDYIFQFILKPYLSINHLLSSFDIDCCCIAYDGKKLWVSQRFKRAYKHASNLVDTTKQSTSYETRLIKYAMRGFSIGIPSFDICRVNFDYLSKLEMYEGEKAKGVPDFYGLSLLMHLSYNMNIYNFQRVMPNYNFDPLIHKSTIEPKYKIDYIYNSYRKCFSKHRETKEYKLLTESSDYSADHFMKLEDEGSVIIYKALFQNNDSKIPDLIVRYKNPNVFDLTENEKRMFEKRSPWLLKVVNHNNNIGSFKPLNGPWYAEAYTPEEGLPVELKKEVDEAKSERKRLNSMFDKDFTGFQIRQDNLMNFGIEDGRNAPSTPVRSEPRTRTPPRVRGSPHPNRSNRRRRILATDLPEVREMVNNLDEIDHMDSHSESDLSFNPDDSDTDTDTNTDTDSSLDNLFQEIERDDNEELIPEDRQTLLDLFRQLPINHVIPEEDIPLIHQEILAYDDNIDMSHINSDQMISEIIRNINSDEREERLRRIVRRYMTGNSSDENENQEENENEEPERLAPQGLLGRFNEVDSDTEENQEEEEPERLVPQGLLGRFNEVESESSESEDNEDIPNDDIPFSLVLVKFRNLYNSGIYIDLNETYNKIFGVILDEPAETILERLLDQQNYETNEQIENMRDEVNRLEQEDNQRLQGREEQKEQEEKEYDPEYESESEQTGGAPETFLTLDPNNEVMTTIKYGKYSDIKDQIMELIVGMIDLFGKDQSILQKTFDIAVSYSDLINYNDAEIQIDTELREYMNVHRIELDQTGKEIMSAILMDFDRPTGYFVNMNVPDMVRRNSDQIYSLIKDYSAKYNELAKLVNKKYKKNIIKLNPHLRVPMFTYINNIKMLTFISDEHNEPMMHKLSTTTFNTENRSFNGKKLTFTPDKKKYIYVLDNRIHVYYKNEDTETKILKIFDPEDENTSRDLGIVDIISSPDSEHIAIIYYPEMDFDSILTIAIYNIITDELVYKIKTNSEFNGFSKIPLICYNGKYLFVSISNETIRYLLEEGTNLTMIKEYITAMTISHDNKYLIYSVKNKTTIVDIETNELIKTIERTENVKSIDMSSNGRYILVHLVTSTIIININELKYNVAIKDPSFKFVKFMNNDIIVYADENQIALLKLIERSNKTLKLVQTDHIYIIEDEIINRLNVIDGFISVGFKNKEKSLLIVRKPKNYLETITKEIGFHSLKIDFVDNPSEDAGGVIRDYYTMCSNQANRELFTENGFLKQELSEYYETIGYLYNRSITYDSYNDVSLSLNVFPLVWLLILYPEIKNITDKKDLMNFLYEKTTVSEKDIYKLLPFLMLDEIDTLFEITPITRDEIPDGISVYGEGYFGLHLKPMVVKFYETEKERDQIHNSLRKNLNEINPHDTTPFNDKTKLCKIKDVLKRDLSKDLEVLKNKGEPQDLKLFSRVKKEFFDLFSVTDFDQINEELLVEMYRKYEILTSAKESVYLHINGFGKTMFYDSDIQRYINADDYEIIDTENDINHDKELMENMENIEYKNDMVVEKGSNESSLRINKYKLNQQNIMIINGNYGMNIKMRMLTSIYRADNLKSVEPGVFNNSNSVLNYYYNKILSNPNFSIMMESFRNNLIPDVIPPLNNVDFVDFIDTVSGSDYDMEYILNNFSDFSNIHTDIQPILKKVLLELSKGDFLDETEDDRKYKEILKNGENFRKYFMHALTSNIKYKHGTELVFRNMEEGGYLYFHSCFNTLDINLGKIGEKIFKRELQKEIADDMKETLKGKISYTIMGGLDTHSGL